MNFNFEKNLPHQSHAVDSVVAVLEGVARIAPQGAHAAQCNPGFDYTADMQYGRNIVALHESNGIAATLAPVKRNSGVLDIEMETGTGKTYTYAKTLFELNRVYGVFKFVIVVPTLSIKAGTISFLKSDSSRAHFRELYGKTIQLYVVESLKGGKSKKARIPAAVAQFVAASATEKDRIQVLVINAGMLTSETMQKSYDRSLLDAYTVPFEGLAATPAFCGCGRAAQVCAGQQSVGSHWKDEAAGHPALWGHLPRTEQRQIREPVVPADGGGCL